MTVTAYTGIQVNDVSVSGSGSNTIGTKYGIYVQAMSAGTVTTQIGLRIDAVTGATNNYGAVIMSPMGLGIAFPTSWLVINGAITTPTGRNMLQISGSGTFASTSVYTDINVVSSYTGVASGTYRGIRTAVTFTVPVATTITEFTSIYVKPSITLTINNSSTIGNMYGIFMDTPAISVGTSSTLSINDYYGTYVSDLTLSGGGTLNYAAKVGIYVQAMSTGTGTNQYGLFVDTVSGATNNYGAAIMSQVGVGTGTPTSMLHVAGTLTSSTNTITAQAGVRFATTVAPSGSGTVTDAATVVLSPAFTVGSIGTWTRSSGLYINTYNFAGAVSNYGLYVRVPGSASGANYAAYFEGLIGIGTQAPGGWVHAVGDVTTTTGLSMLRASGSGTFTSTLAHSDLKIDSSYTSVASGAYYSLSIAPILTIPVSTTTVVVTGINLAHFISIAAAANTPTITTLYGIWSHPTTSVGSAATLTVGTYYGLRIADFSNSGGGALVVNTKYGISVDALAVGATGGIQYGIKMSTIAAATSSTNYGLYVDVITGAASSTNYGLYVAAPTGSGTLYGAYFGGSVGFGTATPSTLVHIAGTQASATDSQAIQTGLYVHSAVNPTAAVTSVATVYVWPSFSVAGGTIGSAIGMYVDAFTVAATYNYGLWVGVPTGGTSGNYGAYIAGKVGIGVTTPTYMMDVAGTMHATGVVTLDTTLNVAGNVVMGTAGSTVSVKTGSNACAGSSALSSGTVTISTTCATGSNEGVFVTLKTPGGTQGNMYKATTSSSSVVLTAVTTTGTTVTTDTSTLNWWLVKMA